MAVEAPSHRERLRLVDDFHLVDAVVAVDTADPAPHVGRVVEVDVVGKVVDAHPRHRQSGRVALAQHDQPGRARADVRVAVHARLGRGDRGVRRVFDVGVAVAAVDAELPRVQRVRVRHRLRRRVPDIGRRRRAAVPDESHEEDRKAEPQSEDEGLQLVNPPREDERAVVGLVPCGWLTISRALPANQGTGATSGT